MPRHVLVLVVGLARRWEAVVRVCELALHGALLLGCSDVVVIDDPLAADDDARAELAEDGSRSHHTNGAALVGMGNDLAVDQVSLLCVVNDDLVELHVLGEEQVAVSETATTRWLG